MFIPVPRDGVGFTVPGIVLTHHPSLPLQSKLSRHGSGAESDYENTQSGEPLLG